MVGGPDSLFFCSQLHKQSCNGKETERTPLKSVRPAIYRKFIFSQDTNFHS
jgi:hypothetical protein